MSSGVPMTAKLGLAGVLVLLLQLLPSQSLPMGTQQRSGDPDVHHGHHVVPVHDVVHEASRRPPPNGVRKFVHLTDIHYDSLYVVGSEANRDAQCHGPPIKLGKHDKHGNPGTGNVTQAGACGTPGVCDTPSDLVRATLEFLESIHDVDFIVWTGDNARHDPSLPPDAEPAFVALEQNKVVQDELTAVNMLLHTTRKMGVEVLPSLGNNDGIFPHNQVPAGPCPQLLALAKAWKPFLSNAEYKMFQRGGYFSRVMGDEQQGRFKILSLNTLFFYAKNRAVQPCNEEGSAGEQQLKWMFTELQDAADKQQFVYLIGHVPPGLEYYPSCFDAYLDLTALFTDIITGHLYGHNHNDDFHVLSTLSRGRSWLPLGSERVVAVKTEAQEKQAAQRADTVPVLKFLRGYERRGWVAGRSHPLSGQSRRRLPEQGMPEGAGDKGPLSQADEAYKLPDNWHISDNYNDPDVPPPHHPGLQDNGVVGVALVAPSVVPTYNPALRVFSYDVHSGKMLDFTQFYIDMDDVSGQLPCTKASLVYRPEYVASEAYGLSDLSGAAFDGILREIVQNPTGHLAQKFEQYKVVSLGYRNVDDSVPTAVGPAMLQENSRRRQTKRQKEQRGGMSISTSMSMSIASSLADTDTLTDAISLALLRVAAHEERCWLCGGAEQGMAPGVEWRVNTGDMYKT